MFIQRREFLRQIGLGSMGLATMMILPGCPSSNQDGLEIFTPESQGVSSQGLINFFDAVKKSDLEFHSIMINRNGKKILEGWWAPFHKEYVHTLYSLSKSFTSTAIGMLSDDGKLDIQAPVVSFFKEKLPTPVSDNLAAMKVYDLLTMHTGHEEDTMSKIRNSGNDDWVKAFLQLEVPLAPGSHFLYNTGATYMLSAIVKKVSGENVMRYLTPRLFEPLGIVGADWETDSQGINVGGYGLRVRTEDILNFGQLYLQQGMWNEKQLLSREWIGEATRRQVESQDNDSDWGQGYGYQFWRCKPGCYRGDGAYGQFCIVIPEKNAVIAITSESRDMGASMQLVWDHILPAMTNETIPPNDALNTSLSKTLSQLALPLPKNPGTGNPDRTAYSGAYKFDGNPFQAEQVSFDFAGDQCEAVFQENGKTTRLTSGLDAWVTGGNKKDGNTVFAIRGRTPMATKISSYFSWEDTSTLVIVLKYIENIHSDIFTFHFTDQGLTMHFDNSVSRFTKVPDDRPPLAAQRIS